MPGNTQKQKMGWVRDIPSINDYSPDHDLVSAKLKAIGQKESIKGMLTRSGVGQKVALPHSVDVRQWCSPIEDQGPLGSCTAHAGVGLLEYFERRAFGKHIDASRLFLYKTTRDLLQWTGDTGAYLRTTMQALVLFGVPPEKYLPYVVENFDDEPSAFCYAFGQNYQAISYYRLDPLGVQHNVLIDRIKTLLAYGFPSMFGFTVFSSINQADVTGKIPFPSPGESVLGGHAIDAVGYDDSIQITNTINNTTTTGALLIRNSWGTGWGNAGYGWLPYEYVLNGLAVDFWSLLYNEWIDTGAFGLMKATP